MRKALIISIAIILIALSVVSVKADLVYSDNFNNQSFTTSWVGGTIVVNNTAPVNDSYYMQQLTDADTNFYTVMNVGSPAVCRMEWDYYDFNNDDLQGEEFGFGNTTAHQFQVSISGRDAVYKYKTPDGYNWYSFPSGDPVDKVTGWHHNTIVTNGTHTNYTMRLSNGSILTTGWVGQAVPCKHIQGYANTQTGKPKFDNIKVYNDTEGESIPETEENFRTAIEQAANATLSGHTISTDQKVYGVNASNSQVLGSFDKFITWNNKRWAVNYLTGAESYTNLFNLTPSLYVLETTGSTSSTLRLNVEKMINTTK